MTRCSGRGPRVLAISTRRRRTAAVDCLMFSREHSSFLFPRPDGFARDMLNSGLLESFGYETSKEKSSSNRRVVFSSLWLPTPESARCVPSRTGFLPFPAPESNFSYISKNTVERYFLVKASNTPFSSHLMKSSTSFLSLFPTSFLYRVPPTTPSWKHCRIKTNAIFEQEFWKMRTLVSFCIQNGKPWKQEWLLALKSIGIGNPKLTSSSKRFRM